MELVRCVFNIVVDLSNEFETGIGVTECCGEARATVGSILLHEYE